MSEQSTSDPFVQALISLEEHLSGLGLLTQQAPQASPALSVDLSACEEDALKRQYDQQLHYYAYLTAQLTRYDSQMGLLEASLQVEKAKALLRAEQNHPKAAAPIRAAHAQTDQAYMEALLMHAQMAGIVGALKEQRSVTSKYMDRLYRELMLRNVPSNQQYAGESRGPAEAHRPLDRAQPAGGRPWDRPGPSARPWQDAR